MCCAYFCSESYTDAFRPQLKCSWVFYSILWHWNDVALPWKQIVLLSDVWAIYQPNYWLKQLNSTEGIKMITQRWSSIRQCWMFLEELSLVHGNQWAPLSSFKYSSFLLFPLLISYNPYSYYNTSLSHHCQFLPFFLSPNFLHYLPHLLENRFSFFFWNFHSNNWSYW